jgi:probable rRNA maturation factor
MAKKSFDEELGVEVQIAPSLTESAQSTVHAAIPSPDRLQVVAETVLRHEGRAGQLTLVLTDDEGIRQLNRDFLGRDRATDVLAFATQEESEPFVAAPEAETYLGDVIISYPRAVAQAEELGHPAHDELDLLVVHGVLHLLGYDHATEEEKTVMWSRQQAILSSL